MRLSSTAGSLDGYSTTKETKKPVESALTNDRLRVSDHLENGIELPLLKSEKVCSFATSFTCFFS